MNANIQTIHLGNDTYRDIGINILTGEACALSMRLLCELTKDAMDLYLEYTGIQINIDAVSTSQWNNHTKYSVFLTWPIMQDLTIMHYAKLGYSIALMKSKSEYKDDFVSLGFLLVSKDSKELREYVNSHSDYHACKRYYEIYEQQPHRGLSNIHAFSGISQ
jgi:hypothetical protein